jgi:hypothetical protein
MMTEDTEDDEPFYDPVILGIVLRSLNQMARNRAEEMGNDSLVDEIDANPEKRWDNLVDLMYGLDR